MLKIEHLSKEFIIDDQTIPAFEDISFEVNKAEFFVVVGPSGCGKSTLLRVISGLTPPSRGKLTWKEKPRLGFVFQNYALFPFLTVYENIEFGLRMEGVEKKVREKIVDDLIDEMGLGGFQDKHPKELSGGMKQRVGIARALAIDPNVLLLDEPFSSLDEFTAATLRSVLLNLWQDRKMTIIMITHLIAEALELSDKVAILSSHPGKLVSVLDNTLPRPRTLRSEKAFKLEDEIKSLVTDQR